MKHPIEVRIETLCQEVSQFSAEVQAYIIETDASLTQIKNEIESLKALITCDRPNP